MADETASVVVQRVTKRYGDFTAVDDLTFRVRPGRIFGFIGPNGAGKTTTIRMIAGITAPDEGSVELFGERMSSSLQGRIGYLPEERGLYKKLRILDQLRYFAALKGISRTDADRRIDYWLERMKLSQWKNKKTTDLSKGMQQKIQFVSTILHDPDLLILDEPFSGLDPVNVEFLIEVLSELKSQKKSIIFSTHVMETAERLCDDILLINRAKKVVEGPLRKVKAGFAKNLIALRVTGGDAVLDDRSVVAYSNQRSDQVEVKLAPDADPQMFLKALINCGASVTKFELIEPSLNDIFLDQIGGAE